MRTITLKYILNVAVLIASTLLLSAAGAFAQINLTASQTMTTLPDGTVVHMWGYSCAPPVATCAALSPSPSVVAGGWSPVVITVPTGQDLVINLTNALPVPTSLVIVGQLGGGLGNVNQRTTDPSPVHDNQGTSWPIANAGPVFTPPAQSNRVRSFATEVPAATPPTTVALTWSGLRPGTYLIESGTHPSIQGPMGLYGILVVTATPGSTAPLATATTGCAYPSPASATVCAAPYNAEVPLLMSEIDPVQNNAVYTAANTAGFQESSVLTPFAGGPIASINIDNPGSGYGSAPNVAFDTTNGSGGVATAVVDTDSTSPTFGQITEIDIINGGNYTSAPKITISGGGGHNGAATAALQLGIAMSHCTGGAKACYPPAVNYTPLYYLINGVAFDKTNAKNSEFPVTAGTVTGPWTGTALVRLVNAGLRMHVPSIVGSQTGTGTPAAAGFSLVAEDGNLLPGLPRVQNEVFMAAGKTYDVMINIPAACNTTGCANPDIPVYDRELSLSGNKTSRDAGMLAYIGINNSTIGAGLPSAGALTAAVAKDDTYPSRIPNQPFTMSNPAQGVIANDTNVYGVTLLAIPTHGSVALNADGTFTYTANGDAGPDSFTYCANGTVSGTPAACSSGITATVTLGAETAESASGITCTPLSFTASTASHHSVFTPGVLAGCKDAAGFPLKVAGVVPPAAQGLTGPGAGTVVVDVNGGFTATANAPGTYTFNFQAQNSQGVTGASVTATVIFPAGNGPSVTVLDGNDKTTVISDYRWVIEEDRTFYVNPNCTTNPPPAGCPTAANGIVPTFGTNFHTSYMPVVAQGCTGPLSCEVGQSIGGNPVVCDVGNGVCRPDPLKVGLSHVLPTQVHLDPTKRYYISVLPGDAANPFEGGAIGHGMGGAPLFAPCNAACTTNFAAVKVLTQPTPFQPAKLSVFVFEDDFPLNGEHDSGGGIDVLSTNEVGLGGFNITLFDDAGGTGDATGQMTYDMFNYPLSNSLAGTIDPATGLDACPIVINARTGVDGVAGTLGITGTIVTCPTYEGDGLTLSPLAGQAVIANMMPGRYGVVATPGADRIAAGEEWLQTNTLDGQKAHDSFLRVGEPQYFQEYGPAGYHVTIGFANPKIINGRKTGVCGGTDLNVTGINCNHTVAGKVTTERMSRTPDERLYSSGTNDSFSFTQCYVSLGDTDGEDFAFTKCNADGTFALTGIPDGNWRITVFDQWNDMLVDGLSTPIGLNTSTNPQKYPASLCPGPTSGGTTCDLGDIAMNQWQANIYTRTFFDANHNGVSDHDTTGVPCTAPGTPAGCNPNYGNDTEQGLTLVPTNNRFRDGSFSNFNNTDLNGYAGFNEIFPLFSWYVIETDSTRYKTTGIHVVYDAGGPADGTCTSSTAPCGSSSSTVANMANSYEQVPLPSTLHVPGAVYCSDAACTGASIANGPNSTTPNTTSRIDPPWVLAEGWQGFSGQNNFIEFGKTPYIAGENGGIRGHVIYASTRPFDDPQLLLQTSWEPLVPGVTINLYQEGAATDGSDRPTLTLIDTTKTSSWDDWAEGFRSNGIPNMNCPGQGRDTGTAADLFFFTLNNQPMWLDFYNSQHGGAAPTALPNNAQFKCFDGMHNWNQVQPAPYDGMYQFPSVNALDPTTGKPASGAPITITAIAQATGNTVVTATTATPNGFTTGSRVTISGAAPAGYNGTFQITVVSPTSFTYNAASMLTTATVKGTAAAAATNCTACTTNPDASDPYRHGAPMLPPGKYVVEVVVPPGYELVKEEDKNILIGDTYIAPVTAQFGGLASIFILPDQASVNAFNSNNPQNPTNDLGAFPRHEGDTGSVESFWPCKGASRVVPDFISLYPQSAEVSPFAGATRNLCDRKEVTLEDQSQSLAKFYIFTSTHVTAHFTGVITDDFTSEFDPFSPQFGEKFSPANLPVSIRDWAGNEISRVYSDQWGTYDGLTYSTWEVNPPNPTGYAPQMMVTCMNDPGDVSAPDPLFNPQYSQFCYEIPFMPGQTQYMDTPVVPTSAFAGAGYNNPDCAYPDLTPAIKQVNGDSTGPWVQGTSGHVTFTVTALGQQTVPNNAYSGPSASTAPYNNKTITRNYGFGSTKGTVAISNGGTTYTVPAASITWSDSTIVFTVPLLSASTNIPQCAMQQQAQYGGPASTSAYARCGQLTITRADNGKQSIDSVTVTVGGKAPLRVGSGAQYSTIQAGIDAALPGDLIIVSPGVYPEILLMWKPVRLQGSGAASTIINANTHPAGKLDPWRAQVNCLFGLALNGQPYSNSTTPVPPATTPNLFDSPGGMSCPGTNGNTWNGWTGGPNNPQVDRLPLEGIVGWDTTVNGNLAELLQEPSLMGAYEGAGITVLAKGVRFPQGGLVFGNGPDTGNVAVESQFPLGTIPLSNNNADCITTAGGTGYSSNFSCNPSRIDGLAITDSSQGGGGIFVHAWAHNLEISNNRIYNNAGTMSGGINVGQGESPDALLIGNNGDPIGFDQQPWTCLSGGITGNYPNQVQQATFGNWATNTQLPYCYDINVNVHNNSITANSSIGDELFSGTPAGAGGVTFCVGSDYYKFNYNWLCGNLSSGDGGGLSHLGFIYNGDIEHNTILFNQSTNPTIATNGGGIIVMGAAPDANATAVNGAECGSVTDVDCTPGLSDGTGPGLVINANLIMGNAAESGSGGGIRLQSVNGTDVGFFPLVATPINLGLLGKYPGWNNVSLTNNIIVNNVAGWDGGGISLQDALVVDIINNTIMSNDTTASSGVLFNTLGAPLASAPGDSNQTTSTTTSAPQVAGVVTMQNSPQLIASLTGVPVLCPAGHPSVTLNGSCRSFSVPTLYNDIIFQNRSFYIGVGSLGTGTTNQQNVVALYNSFTTTQAVTQPTTGATAANGNGSVITGGTGACVSASYWDIGARGDLGPGNHNSGLTLAPRASFITDVGDYTGSTLLLKANSGANPNVASQYCNGSRVPPEFKSLGYQVPPGISDATVPNPIFNLTPAATVDEGNNWINISWGPLTETNPVTNTLLGNYALTLGSTAIGYITPGSSFATYTAAPALDFFGTTRKTNLAVDVGAVEFVASAPATTRSATVSPSTLAFGNWANNATTTLNLTIRNTGSTTLTGGTFNFGVGSPFSQVTTGPFPPGVPSCTGTLNAGASCTLKVQFHPTVLGSYNRTLTVTYALGATVTPATVTLTGTAVNP